MQRINIFLYLFFVLLFASILEAKSFKDIVFDQAEAAFSIDEQQHESSSNFVKLEVEVDEDTNSSTKEIIEQPTLSFYRYDDTSDTYLSIQETDFQPNEEVSGDFNPMTPLLLEDGTKIDISQKIPAIKCLIFKKDEPLIVIYHDKSIQDNKEMNLSISTDKDKEVIRLRNSDENSSLFIGYINTTTKCLKKYNGILFVEKGSEIIASLQEEVDSKSRSVRPRILAVARIESEALITLATEIKKEADIWLKLHASKEISSLGEFIKYTCTIENRGEVDVVDARLHNTLSSGLIYRKDTFYWDDTKQDNLQFSKDIKSFTFPFDIKVGEEKEFSFVSQVDIDAKQFVQSRSYIEYDSKKSNSGIASTKIKKDFSQKSLIVGEVKLEGDDENISLAGVRFYLDNGTLVHSDKHGKFHFENVSLGSHVISIDAMSISGRFTTKECGVNSRNMGSKTSVFVDTKASHIKKVSFCLQEDKQIKALDASLSFSQSNDLQESMPSFNEEHFKREKKSDIFLWPREGFVPSMPSVKVAFLHQSDEKIVLYLNGKKVDMLNYDGFVKESNKKRTISKYRGIDVIDGDNIIEAKVFTKDGTLKKVVKRTIHLSTSPVRAEVIESKSLLLCDGKQSPVIAVKLFDGAGYPLRAGMVGTFSVQKPYLSQERLDLLKENPLSSIGGKDKYTVLEDGIAYITLQPTTTSGEVKLHFPFQNSNEFTKVWLSSTPREWFIIGFAEGSIGYKTIKNQLKPSRSPALYHDKKISLFAKGKVGADALLTIAYDSGKRDDVGILETLDPKSEYTVYADESLQQNEAPSSKKLYIKIEKKSFYALFGDFDTGLDGHELSRYSRRVNGIKSEFKAEKFEYKAFASQSQSAYLRDEIRGDGTSGLYHLKSHPIMIGSQKVTLEVRDRYRDEVILSRRVLNPLLDYNIDYEAGTLYFKEPVLSRDEEGNPQYIIVESESQKSGKKRLTFGGRGAMKFFTGKLELGMTVLADENSDEALDTLYGFDARIHATENIIINAEYASSKKSIENNSTSANAYLLEISHHDRNSQSKIYYKKQSDAFGFGQQNLSQSGTIKYGIDSTIDYWKNVAIKLSVYGDEIPKSGDKKHVAEAFLQYHKNDLLASLGYRYGKSNKEDSGTSQLLSTISKRFFYNKVKLSAAYDYTLGEKSDVVLNRLFAEASYFVNQYVEIFANHEIEEGKSIKQSHSRAGIKGRPWKGATLESSVSDKLENDSTRLFGLLGLHQNYQVNKQLILNASIEKEQTIEGEGEDFTAYAFGVNYRKKSWVYNAKAEYKTAKEEDKINLDLGVYTEVNSDLGMAFGLRSHQIETAQSQSQDASVKFSLAYRPEGDFVVINRLEYLYNGDENAKTSKVVERCLMTMKPSEHSTLSGHYGLKYIQDSIDGVSYDSWIDTAGVEFLYAINKKIELGFQGSLLHAYDSQSLQESLGIYVGYNLFKNAYIGLGYNFMGYIDKDFEGLRESEEGVYLKFRLKFDQESLENIVQKF